MLKATKQSTANDSWLEKEPEEEFKRVQRQFGVLFLIRTKKFGAIMDRLGGIRTTRPVAWFLLYLMPVSAGLGFFLFLSDLGVYLSPRGTSVAHAVANLGPRVILGLPGLNPYIPWLDGYIAIVIAIVVHEGAHGVIARGLGMPVKSSGLILLFGFIPLGAFVEPDENALQTARARDSERVLAGGAGTNLVAAALALLLLILVVSSMTPTTVGVGVVNVSNPSPAYTQGILPGDFLTAVNGVPINSTQQISGASWYKPSQNITVTVLRQGRTLEFNLQLPNASFYKNYTYLLGTTGLGYSDLRGEVSGYAGALFTDPVVYFCLPSFACGSTLPFGGLAALYTSPIGTAAPAVASLFFWIFFLNLNLAIFNALPIYPLDGGQAWFIAVKALGKGKISEEGAMRITLVTTFLLVGLILAVTAYPFVLGSL